MVDIGSKKFYIPIIVILFVAGGACIYVWQNTSVAKKEIATENIVATPTVTPTAQPTISETKPTPTPTTQPKTTVAPTQAPMWPVTYGQNEASSIIVVVNKKHKLPSTYVPPGLTTYGGAQLRTETANAISSLVNAAAGQGFSLRMISGYRSYANQSSTYNSYVARDGQALADTYSARPGHSEHQTGLAIDVGNGTCDLETCFGDTATGKWIAANAQNYGFIIRYPNGKQAETGYQYEPWHLRYLGIDTAKAVAASGKTLDQYYNVEAGGY